MLRLRQVLVAGLVLTGTVWVSKNSDALFASASATGPVRPAARADATSRLAARLTQATRDAAVAHALGQPGASGALRAAPHHPSAHYILVLTNAADGLYIGTKASLAGKSCADFDGGGTDARPVAYRELAGPFASAADAEEALNRGLAERREFPISVGAKGRWAPDGRWYGLWSPTVTGAL